MVASEGLFPAADTFFTNRNKICPAIGDGRRAGWLPGAAAARTDGCLHPGGIPTEMFSKIFLQAALETGCYAPNYHT